MRVKVRRERSSHNASLCGRALWLPTDAGSTRPSISWLIPIPIEGDQSMPPAKKPAARKTRSSSNNARSRRADNPQRG